MNKRRHTSVPSRNSPLTIMTSGNYFDVYNIDHILSSLKFRHLYFSQCVKSEYVNQIWFSTVNSNCTLGGLPASSGRDPLELLVLLLDIFILTSPPADWSVFNVIFSDDAKQIFDSIECFRFTLKSMMDRKMIFVLMFVSN